MIARIVSLLFGVLFVVAAAVQWDDPDSQPWIAVYAAGALAVGAFALKATRDTTRAGRRWAAGAVAFVAAFWAAQLVPRMLREGIALDHEVTREVGGLTLVAVVLTVAALGSRARGR